MKKEDGARKSEFTVLDDLGAEGAISPAELDAVEAFLLPQILALLAGNECRKSANGLESAEKCASMESRF
jgi:hypothetical protein